MTDEKPPHVMPLLVPELITPETKGFENLSLEERLALNAQAAHYVDATVIPQANANVIDPHRKSWAVEGEALAREIGVDAKDFFRLNYGEAVQNPLIQRTVGPIRFVVLAYSKANPSYEDTLQRIRAFLSFVNESRTAIESVRAFPDGRYIEADFLIREIMRIREEEGTRINKIDVIPADPRTKDVKAIKLDAKVREMMVYLNPGMYAAQTEENAASFFQALSLDEAAKEFSRKVDAEIKARLKGNGYAYDVLPGGFVVEYHTPAPRPSKSYSAAFSRLVSPAGKNHTSGTGDLVIVKDLLFTDFINNRGNHLKVSTEQNDGVGNVIITRGKDGDDEASYGARKADGKVYISVASLLDNVARLLAQPPMEMSSPKSEVTYYPGPPQHVLLQRSSATSAALLPAGRV